MRMTLMVLLVLALASLGCVGANNGGNNGNGNATTIVSLVGMSFVPSTITVNAGDTIRFTNNAGFTHDLRVYNSSSEPQPKTVITNGQSIDVKMSTPGTYKLECQRHLPGMVGTIIVK